MLLVPSTRHLAGLNIHVSGFTPGRQCDTRLFSSSLYQWAATLTHSGQNMPFALPFRTDPLPNGFQASSEGQPL